jgi:hypothetical protein
VIDSSPIDDTGSLSMTDLAQYGEVSLFAKLAPVTLRFAVVAETEFPPSLFDLENAIFNHAL